MKKGVIDDMTVFLAECDNTGHEDEYDLFNSFVEAENYKASYDEARNLIDIIRNLKQTDIRILRRVSNIIRERG